MKDSSYSNRLAGALRNDSGGHVVVTGSGGPTS